VRTLGTHGDLAQSRQAAEGGGSRPAALPSLWHGGPARDRFRRWRRFYWAIAGIALWAALVDGGVVRHRALAGPLATLRALADGASGGGLLADVGATAARVGIGVALGLLVGLPVGLWVGISKARRQSVEPGLDFLRAVPPLLLFPLLLLAFGYGDGARVCAVAWAAALDVSLLVAAAAARVHPARLRALRAMGLGRRQLVRWLYLYEVLPGALAALRRATATGLIVAVVTEMVVGAPHGLGTRALTAQIAYDTPALYAVILATGALGFAAGKSLLALERRLVRWR
jgi:ABC-type nitrate/sulfonate/bicarbonate transport system permease component